MAHRRPLAPAAPPASTQRGASPAAVPPTGDPLRRLFTGRRRSKRSRCHIEACLEGTRGAIPATVLSISLHGVLVELEEPQFAAAYCESGLLAYGALLKEHAAGGLALSFSASGLRRSVEVVRLAVGSAADDPLQVGLSFGTPLQPAEFETVCLRSDTRLEPDRRSGR